MNKIFIVFILITSSFCFAQEQSKIESINFIQEGEVSKLIIDFSGEAMAERTHIKSDKQILLDIKNVKTDEKNMRGIDTSEFSGSAVFISPYKKPGTKNDIRFAIQLRDNVRSFIERRKNRLILHIENRFGVFTRAKLKKAEEQDFSVSSSEQEEGEKIFVPKSNSLNDILENLTQSGVKRYVGRKISINVNNLNYPDLLKMIGDTSGFNIIIEDEVRNLPPLTINLTNLPWDQVLDTIMDLGKLVAVKHGNILTIKTAEKARQERQKELDEQKTTKTLEPLVTKIFPISYATTAEINAILSSYSTKNRGTITQDIRTQQLIVKDTVEVIERMKKIIEVLDTQTPQILIQSKIVEANENYAFRAGLGGNGVSFGYDPLGDVATANAGSFQFNSITTDSNPSPIGASIQVFRRLTQLNFRLDLLESESKVKIISSPKVITENNKAAQISTKDTFNFVTTQAGASGVANSQITPVTANTQLNVTPKVTNEGSILMQVQLTKSGFGSQSDPSLPPNTTTNNVNTNVLVDNGSTIVIGGIYSSTNSLSESGIPFLKDLPIIGWLFKSAYNPQRSRTELVIFLTPRVINQEEAGLVNRELDEVGF